MTRFLSIAAAIAFATAAHAEATAKPNYFTVAKATAFVAAVHCNVEYQDDYFEILNRRSDSNVKQSVIVVEAHKMIDQMYAHGDVSIKAFCDKALRLRVRITGR